MGNPLFYLFSKNWEYSAGNRGKIVCFWLMFVLASSTQLLFLPLVMAKIINLVQAQGVTSVSIKWLFGLLLLTLIIQLLFWALHGPARLMEQSNAFRVRANYRRHLLQGIMTLPMEWHVDHHSGDTIDKIEKGTSALYQFSENSFEIIYSLVQLVVSYCMLAYFSPSAAYIVLAMTCLTAWIVMRFDRVLIGHWGQLNHYENKVAESIFDAISNITTVIILRVERLVFQAIVNKVEKPFDLEKKTIRLNETKWFLTNLSCTIMTIAVLSMYFWKNLGIGQGILLGSLYLLIQYLSQISEIFFRFANMYSDVVRRRTKVANAEELAKDFRSENFTNHVLPSDWRRLDINDLNFSYHNGGGETQQLTDLSLSLARGERIALVGESGSGKTTLLKIMRDLYHPRTIDLRADGRKVPEGFAGISRAIALVPQNPEIFATTILENITLGAEYDLDFVRRFVDTACFTEVVDCLPKKFNSSIREKGVNLSGGQQQRLALARGLLACYDKDIVLLDEPTSSLDTATELRVYQSIFQEFEHKTIVASVHRLHLLSLFDRIYFFSRGKVIASGNLDSLLECCDQFQELWKQYHEHHND